VSEHKIHVVQVESGRWVGVCVNCTKTVDVPTPEDVMALEDHAHSDSDVLTFKVTARRAEVTGGVEL